MCIRRANSIAVYAVVAGIFLTAVSPIHALTMRTEDAVVVPFGTVVSDTVFAAGQTVQIDGVIEGDLYCAGQTLTVRGRIDGDILCGVQSADLEGTVSGDLRIAAQTVRIDGSVAKNASILAQTVQIEQGGIITGELLVAAQRLEHAGRVQKNLQAGVQDARLTGDVGKDVVLTLERLELGEQASISGNLTYTSEASAVIGNTQAVAGRITRQEPTKQSSMNSWKETRRQWQPVRLVLSLVLYGLAALALMRWFPRYTHSAVLIMEKQPGKSLLWGFLIYLFAPIVSVLLLITLIGIPLALLLVFAGVILVFLSRVVTVLFFGEKIVSMLQLQTKNIFVTVFFGTLALWILFSLPVVGGLASILVLLWSTGAWIRAYSFHRAGQRVSVTESKKTKLSAVRKSRKR